MNTVLIAILVVGSIGLIVGVFLSLASEKFHVQVNENEEKIGVDIVRGEKISKGILHAVVDVIVYHEDGTFLLMQRDWNKPNKPGLWEAGASGSVVKGEEFLDAAKRELFEETGIKANNLELIYTIKKVEKNTFYKMYTCRCNIKKDSIILQDGETIDYKWVTKNELINLIEKELKFLGEALQNPERPFVSILGGSKVSDKIGVIDSLLEKVDVLLIGGGMAYTFYKALGYKIGNSICEDDKLDLAKELMKKAEEKGVKMLLPIDNKLGKEFSANTETMYADRESIPDGWEGLDIGPKTIELYAEELRKAKTVIWNGTVGVAEFAAFAEGTNKLAQVLAELDATTIIGGGDSAAAVEKAGLADRMTHISTGGGASLEFLEGKKLPGIECLQDK